MATAGRLRFGRVSSGVVSINFGDKTRVQYGGYPTSEAPSTSLSGTNAGDYLIDDTSTLAPATAGAGTYGALWSPTGATWDLTGASAQEYEISLVTGVAHLATRNGAPTNPDGPNANQFYNLFRISTAAGGLALGGAAYWRTGSEYNPTCTLWYFEPLAKANFTGSGRLTVRSEHVDSGIDPNGNPRLQHGGKMGMVYFAAEGGNAVWPFDFRDIWFYTNQATGGTATFFQYATGCSGVGFYNCRVENGPGVVDPAARGGFYVKGDTVIQGCHFANLGDAAAIQINTNAASGVAGTAVIENNIFEGLYSDGLDFSGDNISILSNFFFGWLAHVGNHQDPIQYMGGVGGSTNIDIRNNINVLDVGLICQGTIYISDTDPSAFVAGLNIQNNIGFFGNIHGITIDRGDDPNVRFNTMLTDPFMSSDPTANVLIYLREPGQNGANVSSNIASGINTAPQPGPVTSVNNVVVPRSPGTRAAYIAKLQVMFPNMPSSQADARWLNRAGSLEIFTPADLAVASGGVINVDGTVAGALFPAPPGTGTIGPWNDGSVYDPGSPTWVAAHPPAT